MFRVFRHLQNPFLLLAHYLLYRGKLFFLLCSNKEKTTTALCWSTVACLKIQTETQRELIVCVTWILCWKLKNRITLLARTPTAKRGAAYKPQLCGNYIRIRMINTMIRSCDFQNPYSASLRDKFVLDLVLPFSVVLVAKLELVPLVKGLQFYGLHFFSICRGKKSA